MQDREQLHHRVHAPVLLIRIVEIETAHFEVLLNGEVGEHTPALRDKRDALFDYLVGGCDQRLLSPVHVSAYHGSEAHDGLEYGGLPRAVWAHHGDDFAPAHAQ